MSVITYVNDITTETKIKAHECLSCGVIYGLGAQFEKRRREDHRSFYCPNGHGAHYPQQTDAERLAERLEQERRWRAQAEAREVHTHDQLRATERSLTATKGHVTRAKKRAAAGVCQWCNRSFANVARHVAGQHPEHAAEHGITS